MFVLTRTAVLMLLIACGSNNDDAVDASLCERPALDAPWLSTYVADVMNQLASAPRATAPERDVARMYIADQLRALGVEPQPQSYATGANVIATFAATTEARPMVIVGAHFDGPANSPAANDNASGVAAVLAVARFISETPCRNAPVTIAFFDEEENGLVGSRSYARTLTAGSVSAVHTIDQVVWDADGDRIFELERPTAALEAEWRAAAAIVGVTLMRTNTSGTDHQAFRDLGFPAVGLTEEYVGGDTSPYAHQPTDTAANAAPYLDYLALAAKLAAQVVLAEISPG